MKEVWSKIKKISGKFRMSLSPVLEENGRLIAEPKQVAETLAQHFSTVGENINRSQEFLRHKNQTESLPMRIVEDATEPYNCAITYAELQGCLSSTKETSPGKDEITYNMLKRVDETLMKLLLKLYNKIYQSHSFPAKWLISIIVPIHKKGKDPRKANSYRPISLISCMCKLLEKIVTIRLMRYLEKEQKIKNIQAGFRKQRSNTDPIVEFETTTREAIASKQHLIAVSST